MTTGFQLVRSAIVSSSLLLALGACGNGGGSPPPPASAVIGPAGGTVAAPSGARVVVPPGALAADTTITIEQTSGGSPALPGGLTATGPMFAFTPHGTTFAAPVTVTLPHNPAAVPAGSTPQLYKTNAQNGWEPVSGAAFGAGSVSGSVTSFSFVAVVIPPLQRNDPLRIWKFLQYPGNGGPPVEVPGGGIQSGGLVEALGTFGDAPFDQTIIMTTETLLPDGKANGVVGSTADGVTYSVLAEAPYASVGSPLPLGSKTTLKQLQSFVKRSNDATLTFTVTKVVLEAFDFNTRADPVNLIRSEVLLSVGAYKTSGTYFYYTAGRASVRGRQALFVPSAQDESFSRSPLWTMDQFNFTTETAGYDLGTATCPGRKATLTLKAPRTYSVDLSSIAVGEAFTLRIDTFAETDNRRGGEAVGDCQASAARAFLRDPQGIGGTTLTITGLEPTNQPLPEPPDQPLVAPAACVPGPGPNPAAGVLQFDAASYVIDEYAGAAQTVMVTRTGGSSGAVTATFATSDGTAVAGTDYTPLRATVFFADGDAGQRLVTVPIIPNMVRGSADKTVNLTLSQPGGCAALGSRTSAVLTIRDDEPPLPSDSFLDSSFGTAGKATTEGFGGDDSAMALQPDGKIVMVGGSTSDFVLARFNAGGTLDPGFGSGGKVTTDMIAGGIVEEVGRAVALQPDGKIVVVGNTRVGRPFAFALARYNPDGTLDGSFGTGGKVTSGVSGRAFVVALQPDGKIVVAGDDTVSEDFRLARYNANGTLDASFDGDGQLTTDIGGAPNLARNVVIQPNGAIVVSGHPIGSGPSSEHTDLVRYTPGGGLDASLDGDGKATLSGKRVGEGLALQGDGKLVLVGSVTVGGVARFETMRLNADGSPDAGFGTAGAVSTDLTGRGDAAKAVALQGDGKIVVAGQGNSQGNSNFAAVRYNANGTLDGSFADAGKLTVDFFRFTDVAENVAVQPDGKIVLGGLARNNFDGYGVARVNP